MILGQMFIIYLGHPLSLTQLILIGVYNTCLRLLLDRHAPLVTRTVTDRTSAPWMTLEIKQAKVPYIRSLDDFGFFSLFS